MRIEISGPGKVRVLSEDGEDFSHKLGIYKIEVNVEAQAYPTAVLHCYMMDGFSADVDYANVAATVIHTPELEGQTSCSSSSPHETE